MLDVRVVAICLCLGQEHIVIHAEGAELLAVSAQLGLFVFDVKDAHEPVAAAGEEVGVVVREANLLDWQTVGFNLEELFPRVLQDVD